MIVYYIEIIISGCNCMDSKRFSDTCADGHDKDSLLIMSHHTDQ